MLLYVIRPDSVTPDDLRSPSCVRHFRVQVCVCVCVRACVRVCAYMWVRACVYALSFGVSR